MLYLLHSSDNKKMREKLRELLESLFVKKPNASFFKLDDQNFNENKLDELIGGQGLFENKYIVQMDNLFETKDFKEIILKKIEDISKSDNIFFFLEKELDKKTLDIFEKNAQKIWKFDIKKEGRKFGVYGGKDLNLKDFNIFSLAEAFGNRDKKNLWVLYQKAKMRDIPAEEINGILFWQLKTIFLAKNSKNEKESGLKTFVYNKSLKYAKNFKEEEIKKISSNFVSMYNNAHLGIYNFDYALEKFILEL